MRKLTEKKKKVVCLVQILSPVPQMSHVHLARNWAYFETERNRLFPKYHPKALKTTFLCSFSKTWNAMKRKRSSCTEVLQGKCSVGYDGLTEINERSTQPYPCPNSVQYNKRLYHKCPHSRVWGTGGNIWTMLRTCTWLNSVPLALSSHPTVFVPCLFFFSSLFLCFWKRVSVWPTAPGRVSFPVKNF